MAIKGLHVTPHLGGGVGKALSGLVERSTISNSEFKHIIVSLEENKKRQFIDKINKFNKAIECPDINELENLIKLSDIVQLEWWNHPATIKYLCSSAFNQPIRLITWCHNNGLFSDNIKEEGKLPPIIPKKLILNSHIFLLTSLCSILSKEVSSIISDGFIDKLGIVYSSGGFSDIPGLDKVRENIENTTNRNISVGYFGSTNFAKLNPCYINFLQQLPEKIKVKIIGENQDILNRQCNDIGRAGMLEFTGYIPDYNTLLKELSSINVLAYILNPQHYGTTENALLEAMAMGIVPIVLNNPAECCLVENNETGFIVHSPKEFGEVIRYLSENLDERKNIGINAAETVRDKFSAEKTESSLNKYYRKLMEMEKRKIDFKEIF